MQCRQVSWQLRVSRFRARSSFGLSNEDFIIVAWGRPGASKGFDVLIDSFPLVRRELPSARLVLILSTAPEYQKARSRARRRADPHIIFVDALPLKDLIAIVKDADCAVVPSLAEGFGYTTLEASASGTPVVASDSTSIPEVIGGSYRLFTTGDHHSLAKAIGLVSRGVFETSLLRDFPWEHTVDSYEGTYREMLSIAKKKKLLT